MDQSQSDPSPAMVKQALSSSSDLHGIQIHVMRIGPILPILLFCAQGDKGLVSVAAEWIFNPAALHIWDREVLTQLRFQTLQVLFDGVGDGDGKLHLFLCQKFFWTNFQTSHSLNCRLALPTAPVSLSLLPPYSEH